MIQRYLPIEELFDEQDGTVHVEFIWHPAGAIEIQQKLLTMIAGGEAPDLYWTHTSQSLARLPQCRYYLRRKRSSGKAYSIRQLMSYPSA